MTVIAQNTKETFVSSGSVGPYAFNFPISGPEAMDVIVNGTTLASTAYTIVAVNNNYDNGGSVTLNAAPPSGQTIVLQRNTPLTQTIVFADNLPQPMQQFEDALDKLTEITQDLAANQSGGSGGTTYVTAGPGIVVTGTGTVGNPYVISTTTGFGIASFTGGQSGELGQSFVNPYFSISYTGTPTGATVTNTDNIDSPLALVSPFTTATVMGAFSHSTTATTTFTLTATNGFLSPTATQAITWNPRIFSGVGASGATSSVTASGTTALLSNGVTLPSAALEAESVGQTFGPFTPSGQVIYLLLTGGSHTFIDTGTGFPMTFNAPIAVTFVNQFGVHISMWLYQSTNVLTGTFTPKVAS